MIIAGAEELGVVDGAHLCGRVPGGGRTGAELAVHVFTPAFDLIGVVGPARAGVAPAGRELDIRPARVDELGEVAVARHAGAELPLVAAPPAPPLARAPPGAGVLGPGLQVGRAVEHHDLHRRVGAGVLVVAELAGAAVAPAPDGAVALARAGVVPGDGDLLDRPEPAD